MVVGSMARGTVGSVRSSNRKSMAAQNSMPHEDAEELLQKGQKILKGKLFPNMDDLPELGLATVIANVEGLFRSIAGEKPGDRSVSRVYSTVGPVLIAVNPFEQLPCYSKDWASTFRAEGQAGTIDSAGEKYGPHCFCTIEQVYQNLKKNPKQAVVICGESGAGKTVTNKIMMEYLLKTDSSNKNLVRSGSFSKNEGGSSAGVSAGYLTKLAASNALLESFGNAKTVRNDNSSRFGKYSCLSLAGKPLEVCSLAIEHYLLERSRVVDPPLGERNFHIMHQLAELRAEGANHFKYVCKVHGSNKADGTPFANKDEHAELRETMLAAGFSKDLMDSIFKYIEAVLFLGNVDFEPAGDSSKVTASSSKDLGEAASRLGVEAQKLGEALCQVFISTPQGMIKKDVNVEKARQQREAVAKMLYSRIFDWIIRIIDTNLAQGKNGNAAHKIGLLDIFGFEDMPINLFEQMFINLTNEQIQLLFNTVMVEKELEVYRQEGIESIFRVPPSTQPCLDLFMAEKPQGVIYMMAEQLRAPGTLEDKDGKSLVSKFNNQFQDHLHFLEADPGVIGRVIKEKEKKWNKEIHFFHTESFQVRHYAGTVTYTVREFLSRSIDNIESHISDLLNTATEEHVQDIMADGPVHSEVSMGAAKSMKPKKRLTVGEKFVLQLRSLLEELTSSQSVFVRCIKPTPTLLPQRFDPTLVLEQLRCGGVVAALEIRKAGLPDRLPYADFMDEFWPLEFGENRRRSKNKPETVRCQEIMAGLIIMDPEKPIYALGRTKAFFKTGVLTLLRRFLSFKISFAARVVQRLWRIKCGRKLLYDIERQQKRLAEDAAEAQARGFLGMGNLKDQISECEKVLNKNHVKVQEFKKTTDMKNTKSLDDAAEQVTHCIEPAEMVRMWVICAAVTKTVKEMTQRRADAQQKLDASLVEWKRGLDTLLRSMEDMVTTCDGTSPQETQCKKNCADGTVKISSLLKDGPPKLMKVMATLDFSKDIPLESLMLPKDVDSDTKACEALVEDVERLGNDVLRKKLEIQAQALEDNAEMKSMKAKVDAAKVQLDAMFSNLAEKGDGELYKEARSAVSKALMQYKEMSRLWSKAVHFDVFSAALQKCNSYNALAEEAYTAALALGDSSSGDRKEKVKEILKIIPHGSAFKKSAMRLITIAEITSKEMTDPAKKAAGVAAAGGPMWSDWEHKLHAVHQGLVALSLEAEARGGGADQDQADGGGGVGSSQPLLKGWATKAPVGRMFGGKKRRLMALFDRTIQWSTGETDINNPLGIMCLEEGMELTANGGVVSLKGKKYSLAFTPEAGSATGPEWMAACAKRLDVLYKDEAAQSGGTGSYDVSAFRR